MRTSGTRISALAWARSSWIPSRPAWRPYFATLNSMQWFTATRVALSCSVFPTDFSIAFEETRFSSWHASTCDGIRAFGVAAVMAYWEGRADQPGRAIVMRGKFAACRRGCPRVVQVGTTAVSVANECGPAQLHGTHAQHGRGGARPSEVPRWNRSASKIDLNLAEELRRP